MESKLGLTRPLALFLFLLLLFFRQQTSMKRTLESKADFGQAPGSATSVA